MNPSSDSNSASTSASPANPVDTLQSAQVALLESIISFSKVAISLSQQLSDLIAASSGSSSSSGSSGSTSPSNSNATASFSFAGAPGPNQVVTLNLTNSGTPLAPITYPIKSSDSPVTIATAVASAVNSSSAVSGNSPFLQNVQASNEAVPLTASQSGQAGTNISFSVSVSGTGITVTPSAQTSLALPS